MPKIYEEYFELEEILSQQPRLLQSPYLYNLDDQQLFAAMMDRLAEPPDQGRESPFSGRSPLSGHGQLTGMIIHLLSLFGHEINLVPDSVFLKWFRTLGIEIADAEYPVIELEFQRTQDAINSGVNLFIPIGMVVESSRDPRRFATVTTNIEITGSNSVVRVPARLNQVGLLPQGASISEYQVISRQIRNLAKVTPTQILYPGREQERLGDAMLRARQQLQEGGRCVTARDYYQASIRAGASKVAVLPGLEYPTGNRYSDLITVAVYPSTMVNIVRDVLEERRPLDTRLEVVAAEVIFMEGTITSRIIPSLTDIQAFDAAAIAITENINPPFGKWGDLNLERSVAVALENQPASIYAVPEVSLSQIGTNLKYSDMVPMPWQLFEIHDTTIFNWIR